MTRRENAGDGSRSLHHLVYDRLMQALLQGRFPAGETLTIRGLSAVMGTSEMPIREALRRLVAEKVIVQQSNRSFHVPPLELGELERLIDLRILVEGHATRQACIRASDRLAQTMMQLNDAMQRRLEAQDKFGALRANMEFHFALYGAAGSPIMMDVIRLLWARCGPYLSETMFAFSQSEQFFTSVTLIHQDIVSNFLKRDEAAIVEALTSDLRRTARWYAERAASSHAENDPTFTSALKRDDIRDVLRLN